MLKISEHIYGIMTRGSYVNFYVIVNGDTLSVVDTAIGAGDIDRLEQELRNHSWSMDQIGHILITHAHPDHIGGLAELQKRVNAHTYVHRLDAPVVRGSQPGAMARPEDLGLFGRLIRGMIQSRQASMPARVDTDLNGDEVLDAVLPGLEVFPLPGHSYGHVGFWIPQEGVLIGGDVVMHLPWGLSMPPRPVSPDWAAVKDSIRRVADLAPPTLCLGHGKVIHGKVTLKLRRLL